MTKVHKLVYFLFKLSQFMFSLKRGSLKHVCDFTIYVEGKETIEMYSFVNIGNQMKRCKLPNTLYTGQTWDDHYKILYPVHSV